MKRALVTGGAGLIVSHLVDLLVREGWTVRVLDNLEPQTHRRGKPDWINKHVEFVEGDLRDRDTTTTALDKIDIVFHQAAYGGYMPEIAKYVHVNSFGTAQMLEVIREKKLSIKKIIVASSQAVYSEGAGVCPNHGLVFPPVRPIEQLRKGDWQVHCPVCGAITKSVPTPENAPVGGETVYGLTKVDQEPLLLFWWEQDGNQTRDMSFVEDIAHANLLAAETDKLDGLPVNVGSGHGVAIREIAEIISAALEIDIAPEVNGEFRPGEMRHLTSDITRIGTIGYKPIVDLAEGIQRYIDWI